VGQAAGSRQARGWVAIAAPGRVVWPVVAGLPCRRRRRRRRGWDHTSIPHPGVGCLPWWEGSSCSYWPRRRRGTGVRRQGSGSRFDEVLTPTTRLAPPAPGHRSIAGSSGTPEVDNSIHGSGALPSGVGTQPDRHQTTDLAVGGSNSSRRATITAAQRPYNGVAGCRLGVSLRPNCGHVDGHSKPDCDHHRDFGCIPADRATVGAPARSLL
jgi:hypothetical protein